MEPSTKELGGVTSDAMAIDITSLEDETKLAEEALALIPSGMGGGRKEIDGALTVSRKQLAKTTRASSLLRKFPGNVE